MSCNRKCVALYVNKTGKIQLMELIDEYFLDRARIYRSASNQYSSIGVCVHYGHDPKVVTIVGNCAIPALAALIVVFINHMKRQLALMLEDEE